MKQLFKLSLLLTVLGTASNALALPVEVPETYGGDVSSRPRLTGDWGGVRDDMAKKGIVLDMDVYWMPQSIISGGRDNANADWGNAILTLNLDTQKMGLWPGGFFKMQTVTSFEDSLLKETGAVVPANEAWMLPDVEPETGLQELTFTQFFSQHFGVFLGKINTIAPTNQFHGDYRSGFLNTSMNLPLALAMVPLSAYGAGALYLPTHDLTFAGMLLDPSGTIKSNDLGDAFDDGIMALASADMKIRPFGLLGHQNLTLMWSDKEHLSLDQDPANIGRLLLREKYPALANPGPRLIEFLGKHAPALLVQPEPLNTEENTWAAVYSFEQYLWQPDPKSMQGLGTFFSFGVSDGQANPIKYSFSVGLVGNGIVPGRPHDTFGIGWARTEFSDDFIPLLRNSLDLGLDHEDVTEIYYNAAVTPWLSVTPNLQIIDSGLNKASNSNGDLENLDDAYIAGIRVGIRF